MKASENRTEDIRPCIGCHEGCIWRFMQGKPLSCAVNPACGREREYQLSRTEEPKSVMIIGGGVAGMEAARVAATRGHKVVLYEKGKALGGHLVEAAVPDFKKDVSTLLDWYITQLKKLGVEIKTATQVSPEFVAKVNPDVIVLATGSGPVIPDIPGIENPNVITCIDLMLGKKKAVKDVVVIGGGLVGCETALWLAEDGKQVKIIEILPELMTGGLPVPLMNRMMLIDLLALNNVDVLTSVNVQEITEGWIIVTDKGEGSQGRINADTVVIASGLTSDDDLFMKLAGQFSHVYAIGDCQEPRNIMGAIWDGYEVGRIV